jgi:hypothetical protein
MYSPKINIEWLAYLTLLGASSLMVCPPSIGVHLDHVIEQSPKSPCSGGRVLAHSHLGSTLNKMKILKNVHVCLLHVVKHFAKKQHMHCVGKKR